MVRFPAKKNRTMRFPPPISRFPTLQAMLKRGSHDEVSLNLFSLCGA